MHRYWHQSTHNHKCLQSIPARSLQDITPRHLFDQSTHVFSSLRTQALWSSQLRDAPESAPDVLVSGRPDAFSAFQTWAN